MSGDLVKIAVKLVKAATSDKDLEESLQEDAEKSLQEAIEESLSDFFRSKEKRIQKHWWNHYNEYEPKAKATVYQKRNVENWPIFIGHKFGLGESKT